MGVYSGPDVSESGLVLALDGANYKSFKGEPTTNLITDPLALSGLPSPFTYNAYEATAERTDQLPNSEMKKISPYWIKLVKTSSTNGRAIVYSQSGYTTGVDYCRSFYVYSEDTNLTQVKWVSENTGVETTQSYTQYNPSDLGQIKRIQTILRSVGGSTFGVLRFGTTNPIGTTIWVTGIQAEQKSYPTTVVNGTRGDTVATGGGWADMSGNGNHGQLVNGVRESSDNLGALVFDGADDYVNAPVTKSANCTFSCWAKTTTLASNPMLFNAGPDGIGPDLYFYVGGIYWNTWDGTGNPIASTPSSASDGNWHYYVVVNDSASTARLYYDGVFLGSAAYKIASNNTNLTIGGTTGGYQWNGSISNFQVHNRTLSAQEIQQNFNATRGRYGV